MKTFKCVGWYSANPHDEKTIPYAVVRYVKGIDEHAAFDAGLDDLDSIQGAKKREMLNWYVEEVK